MGDAKRIRVAPISRQVADAIVKRVHYSGKVVANSQLNLGVFLDDVCLGAMQFGPPMDKSKVIGLVRDTAWNGMLELNRLAFDERLPRNSESRAIAVAARMLKALRPDIEWLLSFSDATQCGDGAIYRASGFLLTGLRKNTQTIVFPGGEVVTRMTLTSKMNEPGTMAIKRKYGITGVTSASIKPYLDAGGRYLDGYQLRYILPLNPTVRDRLTVPVVPFDEIPAEARMRRGVHAAAPVGGEVAPPLQGVRPDPAAPQGGV